MKRGSGMDCLGYVRVSGHSQINGDGINRQKDSIRNYCKLNKLNLIDFVIDGGVSGTLLNRNGLTTIFNQNNIHCVVVEKLDRLARDLMVSETLINQFQSKGFNLISTKEGTTLLDENPSRVMIRQLISSVSQYEKSNIVERLRVSRQRIKKERGRCEGRKPLSETKPIIIKLIKGYRRKRKGLRPLSFTKIAGKLNDSGYTTIDGYSWRGSNVQRVFNTY